MWGSVVWGIATANHFFAELSFQKKAQVEGSGATRASGSETQFKTPTYLFHKILVPSSIRHNDSLLSQSVYGKIFKLFQTPVVLNNETN